MWCGEKIEAGGQLTENELATMLEAREVTKSILHRIMRVKPSDYAYISGRNFDGTKAEKE
jgi:hypothetical protein